MTDSGKKTIGVLGGGSWATALTKLLSQSQENVYWWMRNEEAVKHIQEFGHNPNYIQAIEFDLNKVHVSSNLQEIVDANHNLFSNIAERTLKNQEAFNATGYYDWYQWSLDNWGVKWDACKCESKELPDFHTIIYTFDSPWGTPEHFVVELSKLYPSCTFEMVSGSIENDCHYEFVCDNGKFEETCSYETFKEAVEDGKWGGMEQWAEMFEESEEV